MIGSGEGTYGFADGPDGAGVDAVDASQGEDAAEEGGAHDEDTATEEDADDQFSVFIFIFSLVLASANFPPRTDVRTGAMLIGLWRAGERESRQGRHPCCGWLASSLVDFVPACSLPDVGYGEDDVVDSVDSAVVWWVRFRIAVGCRVSAMTLTSGIRVYLPMLLYRKAMEENGEDDRDIGQRAQHRVDPDELLLHETQSIMVSTWAGGLTGNTYVKRL